MECQLEQLLAEKQLVCEQSLLPIDSSTNQVGAFDNRTMQLDSHCNWQEEH